jgi:hypothetical protein
VGREHAEEHHQKGDSGAERGGEIMHDMIFVEYFEGTTCDWRRAKAPKGLIVEVDSDAIEGRDELEAKITSLAALKTWVGDAVIGLGSMLYVIPFEHVEEVIALLNKESIPFNVYTLTTCQFIRLVQ